MKCKILFITFVILFNLGGVVFCVNAQNFWLNTLNTIYQERSSDAVELPNGDFVISVTKDKTLENRMVNPISYLYKTDNKGNIISSKQVKIGGDSILEIKKIALKDSIIILLGIKSIDTNKIISTGELFFAALDMNFNTISYSTFIPTIPNFRFAFVTAHEYDSVICFTTMLHKDTSMYNPQFFGSSYILLLDKSGSFKYDYINNNDYFPLGFTAVGRDSLYIVSTNDLLGKSAGQGFIGHYFVLNNQFSMLDTIPFKNGNNPLLNTFPNKYLQQYDNNTFLVSTYTGGSIGNNANNIGLIQKYSLGDSLPLSFDTLPQHSQQDLYHNFGFDNGNISITNNGSIYYAFTNYTQSSVDIINYIGIKKVNANLDEQWIRFYGGDVNYRLSRLISTSDGGCLVIAMRNEINVPGTIEDLYIFKIDSLGEPLSNNFNGLTRLKNIVIYPNPASESFMIDNEMNESCSLSFFDISGRTIQEKTNLVKGKNRINIPENYTGILLYKIESNHSILSGKIIVR